MCERKNKQQKLSDRMTRCQYNRKGFYSSHYKCVQRTKDKLD